MSAQNIPFSNDEIMIQEQLNVAHRDKLRDMFAAAALGGLLQRIDTFPYHEVESDLIGKQTAEVAYAVADAMLAERERRRG